MTEALAAATADTTTETTGTETTTAANENTAGTETAGTTTTTEGAGTTTETTTAEKPGVPDNWRDLMTGGNEDIAKLINRYSSPSNVGKALLEKERIIREGKPKVERPTDPTDEKGMAAWRKDQGIPDTPEGYKLPEAVTKALTDADKPVLANFTEFVHSKGGRPDVVEIASEWYVESQRAAAEAQLEQDRADAESCEDALRKEWAPAEFKGNRNLATRFIEDQFGMPYNVYSEARLPDGRRLGDIPDHIMKLADRGRETYGDAVFANSDVATKHDDRRKFIEKIRDTDFDLYEREYAKELREIIEVDLKRKKK